VVDLDEAREFLETFHRETQPDGDLELRWAQIKADVAETGLYEQTFAELQFGARVAWRQSARCIGRARWQSMAVRDARRVRGGDAIARELADHLRFATNDGRIRSTITIFGPDDARGAPVRIRNDQLIRYAGYRDPGGLVVGDPHQAEFTADLIDRGWQPPKPQTAFDLLPWLIESRDEAPRIVPVPSAIVLEVPISHPTFPWFAALGLRWHAVPAISNMTLRIGGLTYSCAPFNGFYLVDEIATRNFGDTDRYNVLPEVAARMGLDNGAADNYWQLRAAVEVNTAVLHSFRQAGVRIAEPTAESTLFRTFADREEAAGRPVYGDWSWINGHLGSGFGPAWHRYYHPAEPNPNFWPANHQSPPVATQPAVADPVNADHEPDDIPSLHSERHAVDVSTGRLDDIFSAVAEPDVCAAVDSLQSDINGSVAREAVPMLGEGSARRRLRDRWRRPQC
jgi:nitric-oxide synthase